MIANPPEQTNIFIVLEDLKLQDFITLILIGEGYKVETFNDQEKALEALNTESVDLIIVDYLSPQIKGLEFCKEVRQKFLARYTPILLITPDKEPLVKTKALYSGIDDFIERSFVAEELLFRVKSSLWRVLRYQDLHPITKLPGITTAIKELQIRIETQEVFGVAYADLYHFKKFNDRYGFKKGDEVLQYTGALLRRALLDLGGTSDFLAHFGSGEFFFITAPDAIADVCEQIIADFQEIVPSFYEETDRRRGYIEVKNRRGEILKIPLLRIHMGVATNEYYSFTSPGQILQIAEELKNYAKQFEKSMFIKDRRRSYPFY